MTGSPTEKPASFDLNSDDVAARKRAELKRLFPEVFNEHRIDFDQLRRVMGDWVDEGSERFGLTWPGKAACMKVIQAPATGALRPDRDESVNFDESENVFIEGDNLEVLKLLQQAYFGSIKAIYIDPPYNTGGEFIYPDRYSENLDTYLSYTGQRDAKGRSFSTNTESSGRFHSRWLNMMYPRLYLAKNLLKTNGVIFISIGQEELANLQKVCDEIFGEYNLVTICSRVTKKGGQKGTHFSPCVDYILCYARDIDELAPFREQISQNVIDKVYTKTQEGGKRDGEKYRAMGLYQAMLDARANQRYFIECPDGTLAIPPGPSMPSEQNEGAQIKPQDDDGVWRWTYDRYKIEKEADNIVFVESDKTSLVMPDGKPSKYNINYKIWLEDRLRDGQLPGNILEKFESRHSSVEMKNLDIPFDFAKPVNLIKLLIELSPLEEGDCILDFFAGSASTAHAAIAHSKETGTQVNFLCVQLPEKTKEDSDERKRGFENLAQISRERIRRAIKADGVANAGFRAFTLSESAFSQWEASTEDSENDLLSKLTSHSQNLNDIDAEDLLFEILLKDGFDLTTKIDCKKLVGVDVYSISDGALLICLDRKLTKEVIDELADLAERKDTARVVCLDAGFQGNDQLKANAVQTFKSRLGHGEDGSMFRTV
ncbi:site-specific DNA-methyltransferase [Sphingomonas carotinifaciens]|uniref:site-specific DNA-methyltransferase n=1 Tax=Sphingomonas carotinifaciens TaxID=1166323 RepID=UPI000DDB4237|nr:site-specific DNA-methyltransferase [Sphingomonas carotinifaciens]